MLFSHLKEVTGGQLQCEQDVEVTRFSIDSRSQHGGRGEVFVALVAKRDGHEFVQDARDRGVTNFIVDRPIKVTGANVLIVKDTLEALQQIAGAHRAGFSIPVIGITGSNGKTTVKEWLATILSETYLTVKSPKSYNSQVGVPLSLLEIRKTHEIGVFEAGISKTGEMNVLAGLIRPSIGIFTNLGEAHKDGFESREEKLFEKLALFDSAEKVVCRKDTAYFESISEVLKDRVVPWGDDNDLPFTVVWEEGEIIVNNTSYRADVSSDSQRENVTHAIVTATLLGLNPEQIQRGISKIEDVPMRLELKKAINGCYVLDDSYNNDEIGLIVALDYLDSYKQNEKRTLILSDILHSGKSPEELYRQIAAVMAAKGIDRLIGVGAAIKSASDCFSMDTQFFESTEDLLRHLPTFKDEMIVVKGARDFELERVVKRLEEKSHGTVLEVNLEALQHNLSQYRALLEPTTRLMVMVKANAYGAGILEVANFLQHHQVDMLGVAYVHEAIALRKNGISLPIMIMNPYIESFEQFERFDLQAEVFSLSHLKRLLRDTVDHPGIHIKIDTGMHRLGFGEKDIPELIDFLKEHPNVKVEGIFTHFASADSEKDDAYTVQQAKLFDELYELLAQALNERPIKHACNSPAMVRWPQYHFDMVRLGIGLHGFDPTGKLNLEPTSSLKSTISQIQQLQKGDTVGYSRKGKAERDSRIAIVPIGYEDGYLRVFGNGNGKALISGELCPTIGNVCMDMVMIDITHVAASEGDEVILFGAKPSIQDLAIWADTIPYEILTNISSRVKRVFVSE